MVSAPLPAEQFADAASTTVPSGGTSAPSSLTQETWTVTSSAAFPSLGTPGQVFYVADPAAPTELIQVISVVSTTWTVIRGAQGTATVTHTGGFTVKQVVSLYWYQQVSSPAMAYAVAQGVLLP